MPPIRSSQTISNVQSPIIPVVGEWMRNTPDTLSLGQGMVSYSPPPLAMQAIANFGQLPLDHLYSSPLGHPQLLQLITNKLRVENGIDCQQYSVMVTAGSNMGFLNVLMAIVDPGDEIILPLPYYFNQEMAVKLVHCKPVAVPTTADYQLDLDLIRAAITPRTRAIVTVSPNNPSGAVYPEAALRAINALCAEHGIYHISDEAYEYFTYGSARHFSPGCITGAQQHTISLYSLSKAYGFASWRIGYVVFPSALLPDLLKVQDTNLICPPTITQQAAIGALTVGSAYCKAQLDNLTKTRNQVLTQLQSIPKLCQTSTTEGAFYFLIQCHTKKNDLQLVEKLIKRYQIAVIPGCAFGIDQGCFLRISYGMLDDSRVELAMQRLVKGLEVLL